MAGAGRPRHLGNPALPDPAVRIRLHRIGRWRHLGNLVEPGRGALYAAGLRNVMDIGGRLQMGFSLLVASSASLPTQRPLCVDGDATQWLQRSGEEAMRHLLPWRLERCTAAADVRPEWATDAQARQAAPV